MRISLRGDSDGVRVLMRFDQSRNRWLATRILLAVLTVQGAAIGLWATLAPMNFYRDFPGFGGMHWVAQDGPYNHHLIGDIGAFFLALSAISLAALYLDRGDPARLAGLGWVIFGVPHFIYHAFHRPAEMGVGSFALAVVATVLLPALGLALFLVAPRGAQIPDPAPMQFRFRRRPRDSG